MQQKAADELVGGKRHYLLPVGAAAAIVLVAEGDSGLIEPHEPTVRDGDAVGVARQISEHRFRASEWRLRVDYPALLTNGREVPQEGSAIGERGYGAEEPQPAGCVECKQPGQEQTAEQRTEHAHGQEERRTGRDPALA